ncbi:FYVE, RhoGEF and PH domain-containing protein 2 [Zootoca vivipara]|uniref:FYVE, RhoGEF and PH domain-containing protein 2 n=1 Tax=Zootoca vivipara TaxID=8524 RepID=UPI00293BC3CC|nr:FYVE, RhoGEF and PH domain-containing protein 2 [Zootoca vivipara]
MEEQSYTATSVVNLVDAFEKLRACPSPSKEQILPQSGPCLRAPNLMVSYLLPPATSGRAMSEAKETPVQHSQMPCRAESATEPREAPRGLTVKCLSSFRGKISAGNWRIPQDADFQASLRTDSSSSENQEPEEKKIALELLQTEQAYVSRLYLLDQVFFSELLKEARSGRTFPEEVVKMIFSNISSIYQFHAQFFLPELQKRMENWGSNPRIGDIIQKVAPFLKMYSEYVKNFDKAVELITTWSEKSLSFQELISSIQRREISANLTLQHHMLEPVQRIPRYELLLKDYIRKLPPEAPDREDAQKALEMIFTAAKHSNAAIAEMERLQNLWEVYHRLGLEDDIVDPSNELIKEGPIQKISFRHNNTTEKYLFLFNNLLLYCVPKVIQVGAAFQVHSRIDVEGMKVRELNDVQFPYAFLVSGKQRTLELQTRSQEEMNDWIKAFESAIDKKEKRSGTFKVAIQGPEAEMQDLSHCQFDELGKRAPQWIRDKLVTMCMRCKGPFNAITRRRHHCRACGYVVCGRCSEYKAELQYDKSGPKRVCMECYIFLTGHLLPDERQARHKGILEKESAEISGQSLMCSFLQLLDKNGKGSMRGWFVIPRDDPLVLYIYAAPQDVKAHTSIPLLGYQVKEMPQNDTRHIFQLVQSKQVYTLVAETEELKQRWIKAITHSARGEEEEDSFDELE